MLELIGSEDKEVKVKVRVAATAAGNIAIYYDDILVSYVAKTSGSIYTVLLAPYEVEELRGKGVRIEDDQVKSISQLGE